MQFDPLILSTPRGAPTFGTKLDGQGSCSKVAEGANGHADPGGLKLLFGVGIQFARFAAVGVVGTLGHYLVLVALVHLIGANPVPASGAGSAVGAVLNYFLNYRFTFNSNERHRVALPRFLFVMLIGFLLNLFIMYVSVDIFDIYYLLAQVISTGVVLVWNFAGNKFWTFGNNVFFREGKHGPPCAALDIPCATNGSKGFRSWLRRLT